MVGGITVKLVLVVVSFVQAHWLPIACAAGTVVAATMFGDKAYWTNISNEAAKAIAEKKPLEAVKFIEAEIAKYPKWKQENPDRASYTDRQINDLYFHLAKAKESAGLDKTEQTIVEALGEGPVTLDEVVRRTGLPSGKAASAMTMLVLKGVVAQYPGNLFGRKRRGKGPDSGNRD